jgi:hypothetical protein
MTGIHRNTIMRLGVRIGQAARLLCITRQEIAKQYHAPPNCLDSQQAMENSLGLRSGVILVVANLV